MKHIGTTLSMLVLAGSLATSAMAANDGMLVKDDAGGNYCHMKFPAITHNSLGTNSPRLKSTQSGDVIDFYGECDETPAGKDQVQAQLLEEYYAFTVNFND